MEYKGYTLSSRIMSTVIEDARYYLIIDPNGCLVKLTPSCMTKEEAGRWAKNWIDSEERREGLMGSITDIGTYSNKPEYKFWGQDETDSDVKETETGFIITIKDLGVWHKE